MTNKLNAVASDFVIRHLSQSLTKYRSHEKSRNAPTRRDSPSLRPFSILRTHLPVLRILQDARKCGGGRALLRGSRVRASRNNRRLVAIDHLFWWRDPNSSENFAT